MYLTRHKIKEHIIKINKYIKIEKKLGKKSIIYKSAKNICRNNEIIINYSKNTLDNIEFIYDDIYKHWAETDAHTIWLNTYKYFDDNTLYYTLLHEYMHGLICRKNKHYLSENLEHKIMKLVDINLI